MTESQKNALRALEICEQFAATLQGQLERALPTIRGTDLGFRDKHAGERIDRLQGVLAALKSV